MATTRVKRPKSSALPERLRPRKEPVQERAKELVDAIVEAGSRVLVESGYEALSMQRVAKVSGVSPGSLYQYFPDKAALIATIIERMSLRELEFVTAMFVNQAPPTTLDVALDTMVRGVLAFQRQEGPAMRRALESLTHLGRYPSLSGRAGQAAAMFRSILEVHRDEIPGLDLDLATHVLINAMHSLTHDGVMRRPASLDDETLVRELLRLARGYLGLAQREPGAPSEAQPPMP